MNLCMNRIRKVVNITKCWDDFKANPTREQLICIVTNAEYQMKSEIIKDFKILGYEVKLFTIVNLLNYEHLPISKESFEDKFINNITFRVHIFDKKGCVYTVYKFPEMHLEWNEILQSELQNPKNIGKPRIMTFLIDLKSKLIS